MHLKEAVEILKNNKIIITSIIFCIILLVLGSTTAFFGQDTYKKTDSLVTTDINDSLKYTDNTDYMRGNLIPSSLENVIKGYNIEGDNKCIDNNGYAACSVYEFTITNNANVEQELIIDMLPTVNTFTNLYFILYEIKDAEIKEKKSSTQLMKITDEMIQNNEEQIVNLQNKVSIKPNKSKTYQIVFYIKNLDEDQTSMDAGKQFGSMIKISSVASGQYIIKQFGEECWGVSGKTALSLLTFNGVDEYGNIKEACTGYVEQCGEDNYSVYIPESIGGIPVTYLNKDLLSNNPNLISLTIPSSVIEIGNYAFRNNVNLKKINFIDTEEKPSQLKSIGIASFKGDASLTSIELPSNIETIGSEAFVNNPSLTSIVISASVKTIGKETFKNNLNLSNVTFIDTEDNPSQLHTIGDAAFYGNPISNLIIPSNVKIIDSSAFYGNEKVTDLVIPASVEAIKVNAFGNNSNLTNLTFEDTKENPSQLQTIGNYAFSYNSSLTNLVLPSNLKTIGMYTFQNNTSLTNLIIPSSVVTLGHCSFSGNTSLSNVTIIDSEDKCSKLETIGSCSFQNNSNLTKIEIPTSVTTIGNRAFQSDKNLTNVIFKDTEENPSKLETIDVYAFEGCNLSYNSSDNPLIIPSSVNSIGQHAFRSNATNNPNLLFIKYNGTNEDILNNTTNWYSSSYTSLNK